MYVFPGGAQENVSQPRWSVHAGRTTLLYLSDRAKGWWNIHKAEFTTTPLDSVATLLPFRASPVLLCEGKTDCARKKSTKKKIADARKFPLKLYLLITLIYCT
jgi:hypothetical protein